MSVRLKRINMFDTIKIITVGSVDDGKSSLIGRLLYDNKSIYQNQIDDINNNSILDLSRITDGLKSEREQGITIDVAYKFFNTPTGRKVILIDSPGHIQYTKNMVTGASNADLALILIDARHGITEQTKRHFYICCLLGIKYFAVCINKMDLVDYSNEIFNKILTDFYSFSGNIDFKKCIKFIPTNAIEGYNVFKKPDNKLNIMQWNTFGTLLEHIEDVNIYSDERNLPLRFCVQNIIKTKDYRGYAGKILSGTLKINDEIIVLPSNIKTKIKSIDFNGQQLMSAEQNQSVIIRTENEIDISRGNIISSTLDIPCVSDRIEVDLCWLNQNMLFVGNKYYLQQNSFYCQCIIEEIIYKIDINTLKKDFSNNKHFDLNDIGKIIIKTSKPIVFDEYQNNKHTGSFILIDKISNNTVGACMIRKIPSDF